MFVRLDMTAAGDSGALLVALVNYMLRPSTQASMPLLGLQPLPSNVLDYTVNRALPLIVPDMRASKWMYEVTAAQYSGAGDFVMTDPSLKTTYLLSESIALRSSVATLAGAVLNQTSNINVTALLANYTSNAVPPDLLDRLTAMDNQLSKLQSVAIAGVIFGIAGVALALFAFCRVFVVAATSAVFPGSMATTSSVRRGKSFSTGGDLTVFAKAGPVPPIASPV
ncbi:phosphate-binding protein PstS, partial [Haematococcus lacustris]